MGLIGTVMLAIGLLAPDVFGGQPPEPIRPPGELGDGAALGKPTPLTDPTGKALEAFYDSLRATEKGDSKTRVVIYGASHMAGDAFSREIRHRLQRRFGDGGPGFVVPSRPWRNYNHRDVGIHYSKRWDYYFVSRSHNRDDGLYGLAGVSFEASSKHRWASVNTAKTSEFGREVSRVELYYWRQKRGGDISVKIDNARPVRVKTRASRKQPAGPAYRLFELKDGPHTVELRPRGNGSTLLFGLSLERDRPGVVVDTMGVNGARASALLKWDPELHTAHLRRRDPALVVLAYGTNAIGDDNDPIDEYEARLDRVLTYVRKAVPEASCLFIGPSDRPVKVWIPLETDANGARKAGKPAKSHRNGKRSRRDEDLAFLPRPRQAQVIEAQQRVSHRHGCAHWDWVAMMGGDLSMVSWVHSEPRLGARDYVHLTGAGYRRAAELFWEALMTGYESPAKDAAN